MRLAPRPWSLAGREELLAQLDTILSGGESGKLRTVVLCGLGGVGKTTVAVEYAYRHLAEVGVAWQFAAEDPTVLTAEFAELAGQLGARDLFDIRGPVASVHAVLAAYPAKWLLVFDNVHDLSAVEAFLPPAGDGRILITSQRSHWLPGQSLNVPVLDQEAAANFLVNRTGDLDKQSAGDLAVELGGLPLALEQAAAYIQATGNSVARYLELFRQRRPELLSRGEVAVYGKTVAKTWRLAFDRLSKSNPSAIILLRLLAFCAPEAIPLNLLLQSRPGLAERLGRDLAPVLTPLLDDPLAASDAIIALRQYSLISAPVYGAVSVHRLVQAVTRSQMTADTTEMWEIAVASVIDAAIPRNPEKPQSWTDFAALLPHAQTALTPDSIAMDRVASYLGYSGNYTAAYQLYQRVLAARENLLGFEHPNTLDARRNVAYWTGEAGDATAATNLFVALLPALRRVLGPDNPETLAAQAHLAFFAGEAGDASFAQGLLATLLPVRERILGSEHPDTLSTRRLLALWTGEAGDSVAARDLSAALLPRFQSIFGPEHPETLSLCHSLAYWTGEAGDATAARDQFATLLPLRERILGSEHPRTVITQQNLAHWAGKAGDAAGACDGYQNVLRVRERILGPEHPDTMAARTELLFWAAEAENAACAEAEYGDLLRIHERILGPEHPDTLSTRHSLAYWTGEAGDAAAARNQFATLLSVRERVSGREHPDTLTVRNNVAYWTGEAGDAAGARDQFATLLSVRERVSGPEHPDSLTVRENLAYFTRQAEENPPPASSPT